MVVRRAIPKKAVKPLIEHCNRFGEKTGRSGAALFVCYMAWMKKYADYVFSDPWPPKLVHDGKSGLPSEVVKFILGGSSFEEEVERFTVVFLKRNLSLEGFDAECFESQFDFYGRMFCDGCCVPGAMYLRWYVQKLEETNREIEESARANPHDDCNRRLWEFRSSPEERRSGKMADVKLEFFEKEGVSLGKTCEVRNKYLCPYGAGSRRLIRKGGVVELLWSFIEYYDDHWNRKKNSFVPRGEDKWFHFDEVGFLDVTSREDILKAMDDGRMRKIWAEFDEYQNCKK